MWESVILLLSNESRSSDRGFHDEIFMIDDAGSTDDESVITQHDSEQSYEPSFSPNGEWGVFESHSAI